jgi:hypothetical protein
MSDIDSQAAKDFYKAVRLFAERTKLWELAIFHEVLLDEMWDATLISQRVYGNRDEFLTIMAAAGCDTVDQPIPQMQLVLPTLAQLYSLKRKAGFESIEANREGRKPAWVD